MRKLNSVFLGSFLACILLYSCNSETDDAQSIAKEGPVEQSIAATEPVAMPSASIFQNAPFIALVKGVFDGNMSFGQLKKYGDFGLGALDRLNGEIIGLDGVFYRFKSDGTVKVISDEQILLLENCLRPTR